MIPGGGYYIVRSDSRRFIRFSITDTNYKSTHRRDHWYPVATIIFQV
jgi:hypothetical protein